MADYKITNIQTENLSNTGRFHTAKGDNVTAALLITLGEGNYFVITGATAEIRGFRKEDWRNGTTILVRFTESGITLKHDSLFDPNYYGFYFQSQSDVSTTENMSLNFVFDEDDGLWYCSTNV